MPMKSLMKGDTTPPQMCNILVYGYLLQKVYRPLDYVEYFPHPVRQDTDLPVVTAVETPVLVTPEFWVVFFFTPYAAKEGRGRGENTSSLPQRVLESFRWLHPPELEVSNRK